MGNLGNFHLGGADDFQFGFLHRFLNRTGVQVVYSFLVEEAFAVQFFDGFAGGFALAEAGDFDLLHPSLVNLLTGLFKFLGGNGKLQFKFIGRRVVF